MIYLPCVGSGFIQKDARRESPPERRVSPPKAFASAGADVSHGAAKRPNHGSAAVDRRKQSLPALGRTWREASQHAGDLRPRHFRESGRNLIDVE